MARREPTGGRNEKRERGRYDRAMIRDFIDHLLWELRSASFAYQQERRGASAGHPELDEVLDRYFQQYRVGLLPLTVYDYDGATPAQVRAARHERNITLPALRVSQLRLLEGLRSLIEEALECADPRAWEEDQVPVRVVSARKLRPDEDAD